VPAPEACEVRLSLLGEGGGEGLEGVFLGGGRGDVDFYGLFVYEEDGVVVETGKGLDELAPNYVRGGVAV
jgi:hypothetical protein